MNKRGKRYGFSEILKKNQISQDEVKTIAKCREDIVNIVKTGKVKECPVDPVLSEICPSCE